MWEVLSLAEENAVECTACGEAHNSRDHGRGESYRFCQNHEFVSLRDVVLSRLQFSSEYF